MLNSSQDPHISEVERQMERGNIHNLQVLHQLAERLHAAEAYLYGLVDLLSKSHDLDMDQLQSAIENAQAYLKEQDDKPRANILIREDKPDASNTVNLVNCAERMHICQAVCCKLSVPLSTEEVESGSLKWDLGRPYLLRQNEKGYCVYNDGTTGGCNNYENRPTPCRRYTCANDDRIWIDFDAMILNEEWLENRFGQMEISDLESKAQD